MKLITKELEKIIPAFYSSEDIELDDKMVYAKFFLASFTWWVLEYDKESNSIFALVEGLDKELGYASIKELESVRHLTLSVERDLYFTPTRFGDLNI